MSNDDRHLHCFQPILAAATFRSLTHFQTLTQQNVNDAVVIVNIMCVASLRVSFSQLLDKFSLQFL